MLSVPLNVSDNVPKTGQRLRVFIGTPCYGGMCHSEYANSLLKTRNYLEAKGVSMELCFLINESLIPRGRNTCVAQFLSDPLATHLLFIDSDIVWKPEHIERMLKHNVGVVGGLYPKKNYQWNKLKNLKLDDMNESQIKANLLDYVVNYGNSKRVHNGLIEVSYIGTGFMMIRRDTLLKMIEQYPEYHYNDDVGMLRPDQNKWLYSLFSCPVVNERLLSEDYNFCRLWINMGGKVYADLAIDLSHIGTHKFEGNVLKTLMIKNPTNYKPLIPHQIYEATKGNLVFPDDIEHTITENNLRLHLGNFFANKIPNYPVGRYQGKGIVICAGGKKYLESAFCIVKTIREINKCNLPIEWFYAGEIEISEKQKEFIQSSFSDVKCIDATKVPTFEGHTPPLKLRGYQIKPFSLIACSFEEVILVDADNFPLQDLSKLFEDQTYLNNHALFWGDLWNDWIDHSIYGLLGIDYSAFKEVKDTESGQLIVNKKECWKGLNLAWYFNNHAYFFYKFMVGDKDLYRLAWLKCGYPFKQNFYLPQMVGNIVDQDFHGTSMLHYDMYGHPLFIHCTLDKDIHNLRWKRLMINKKNEWQFVDGTYIKPAESVKRYCNIVKPPETLLRIQKLIQNTNWGGEEPSNVSMEITRN